MRGNVFEVSVEAIESDAETVRKYVVFSTVSPHPSPLPEERGFQDKISYVADSCAACVARWINSSGMSSNEA